MDSYNNIHRVKDYVDKFCFKENISVQDALETAVVKSYIEYASDKENEIRLPNMWGSAGQAHDNISGGED